MAENRTIYSTAEELARIAHILQNYARLPFSPINIPGAVMEGVLGHVRRGEVLRTYDFVDVVNRKSQLGWQIKSTLAGTPVTWKRAKIPERIQLIASEKSAEGLQSLGDAIIGFCNKHAEESIKGYDLREIGYARLVIHESGQAMYFERRLCTRAKPQIFDPKEFLWRWSIPKRTAKKEQLIALHGTHKPTGKKWFAWHGRGENQLHFSGENAWWPSGGDHRVEFQLPSESGRLTLEAFIQAACCLREPLALRLTSLSHHCLSNPANEQRWNRIPDLASLLRVSSNEFETIRKSLKASCFPDCDDAEVLRVAEPTRPGVKNPASYRRRYHILCQSAIRAAVSGLGS